MEKEKKILNFFYELGMLKRIPRTGWIRAQIKHPESIGDHTSRSTFIAFVIGKIEGADAKECALINAFHEMGECRVNDLDKVQSSYFTNKREVEKQAVKDQLEMLPEEVAKELGSYVLEEGNDSTKEHIIARDSDYVECALQAKEYLEQGYTHCQNWIDNCKKCVKTETAKKLLEMVDNSNSQDWYKNLKKIQR